MLQQLPWKPWKRSALVGTLVSLYPHISLRAFLAFSSDSLDLSSPSSVIPILNPLNPPEYIVCFQNRSLIVHQYESITQESQSQETI